MEFPGNATPVTPAAMAAAIVPAYVQRFGHEPDRETAELLLALLFIENDHGRAVIEHNWGNISVFAGPTVDYWRPPWFDLESIEARPDTDPKKARYLDLHQRMLDHKAPSAFRAFRDDQSGIVVWLANVKPSMYDAAATGDPMAFANAYWSSGYCPDEACKNSGPTFRALQAEIRKAGYFPTLKPAKKAGPPVAAVGNPSSAQAAAAAVVASSSQPSPLPSPSASSGRPSAPSQEAARMVGRESVVFAGRVELAMVNQGDFEEQTIAEYWADVLASAVGAPHPVAWCGAFVLWCLHQAELGRELHWRFETATDKRSGFLYALHRIYPSRGELPEPGDVGYQDKPYQHHFLVESVDGETVHTIEGNQGEPKPIQAHTRKLHDPALAWFSIAKLLPAPEAV